MTRKAQSGQAIVLMAVIIATLFMMFMLLFEIGRLLVARAVITSASQRAGEAALSYLVEYAQNRAEWNQVAQNALDNRQVWAVFYDTQTGVPDWLSSQAMRYLNLNLSDHLELIRKDSIDALNRSQVVTFPYKDPTWPTATIGIQLHFTVQVPLFFFTFLGQPTAPITVQTTSITSVAELLGLDNSATGRIGDAGSVELASGLHTLRPSADCPNCKWVEPFANFNNWLPIAQYWGCPSQTVSAYRYAKGRHAGIDIGIPEGTSLFAIASGTVVNAAFYPFQINPVGNNAVIIKTDDGYYITYMHMLSFNVTKGQHVNAGDLIGISDGDPKLHPPTFTGFTSGPHLHLQIAKGNFYDYPDDTDPWPLLGLNKASDKAVQPDPTTGCVNISK
ncbi:MAG: peptidoglycan DD-metalloendopeptidase family protein [Aggregatilineales bacterium]